MSGLRRGERGDLGDDLLHVLGDVGLDAGVGGGDFLLDDADFLSNVLGVVGPDQRAVAVFEGRDDAAAVGVILGVGAGHDVDVEGELDAVALDLDVALFHEVEQADLDALGEVGELVDAEEAAVVPRYEAVVDGELVGEIAAFGDLDGVDLADEIGHGDVGGGQLLGVALLAVHPGDGGLVAEGLHLLDGELGDGVEGIVVDLASRDDGDPLVEQVDHGADQASLRLASLAEEDDVVLGEDRVLDLGYDGVVVADDAGEEVFALLDLGDEVAAELLLHRGATVGAPFQCAKRASLRGSSHSSSLLRKGPGCEVRRAGDASRRWAAEALEAGRRASIAARFRLRQVRVSLSAPGSR